MNEENPWIETIKAMARIIEMQDEQIRQLSEANQRAWQHGESFKETLDRG